ncbi:CapA family protein [Cohnella sp.]|uniref:CapA family protein n=1 Tax=Cohnella sp. TaxID=1883426 RepID=UPI0035692614
MNTLRRHALYSIIGLLAITLTACSSVSAPSSPLPAPLLETGAAPGYSGPSASSAASAPPVVTERQEATLLAVGDIMVHMPQLPAYYNMATKKYDLTPWFSQVKPLFLNADWVIGNLETPIAGEDLKYTGFPRFNAPYELAEALADAGVSLVSTANNHSLDRGFPGIKRTLNNLREAGLIPVGTAESSEQALETVIVERNGIRMGFLSYTYGTNGIPIPSDKPYAVNLIELNSIKKDIIKLRKADADIITVSLHFGQEYQRLPNEAQKSIAYEIVQAGGDIILGSHPHVVQPFEEIQIPASESEDGLPHRGVVIYSLGNFISNQTGDWKDVGLIFGVRVVKTRQSDGSTSTTWDTVTTEPTWVHIHRKDQKRYYTIFPLKSVLINKDAPDLTESDYSKMKNLLSGINKHLLILQAP